MVLLLGASRSGSVVAVSVVRHRCPAGRRTGQGDVGRMVIALREPLNMWAGGQDLCLSSPYAPPIRDGGVIS